MKELQISGSLRHLASVGILAAGCGAPQPAESPPPVPPEVGPPAPVLAPTATAAPAPAVPAAAPLAGSIAVAVSVTNTAAVPHVRETVALSALELEKVAPGLELDKTLVADAQGNEVLSQVVHGVDGAPGELVFQTDLAPSAQQSFTVRIGERKPAKAGDYKVYGRFVRERHDDFAWENDLVAHRMYGPDLETTKKEPLVSSGIDVWAKRVPRLLVNEWYMTDDYHEDHGDGADFYSVGKTRGCGGLGIWSRDKLMVSRNFVTSRVLANGPLRLVFELDYAPWDAGGTKVSETKRVTLDAGTFFNRFESTFTTKRSPLNVAIGISKHPGGAVQIDAATASMRVWEPVDGGKSGALGCAIVLAPGSTGTEKQTDDTFLLVTQAKPKEALRYYVGSTWDRAGHVTSADAWAGEVKKLAARIAAPPRVELKAGPAAGAAPAAPPAAATH